MITPHPFTGRNDGLTRLDRKYYRGQAYVHWTLAIQNRKTGWLRSSLYYKFRELLTHTAFRYSITCPIYCLMPDHMHLFWIGIDDQTDQLNAMRYFRRQIAIPLKVLQYELQHQPYDHVLQDDERREDSIQNLVEYIARNPERKQLVPIDHFREYKFTGCLIPGYPEITLWQPDFWNSFWQTYAYLRKNGLFRSHSNEPNDVT